MAATLNLIRELMNSDVEFLTDDLSAFAPVSQVFRLWCDNTKIRELTGFDRHTTFDPASKPRWSGLPAPENSARNYKADIYNV